ncbi:unnamed protein product, partial [marine sediment metagenome]
KLKVNRNADVRHELKLMEIVTKLLYEGRSVVIGGKLKNGQIPDICVIDLEKAKIYEIGNTERELKESKNYPFPVTFIKVKNETNKV